MNEKILIAEDDLFLRKLVGRCLADKGFSILHAADAETARDFAISDRPGLILSDYNLGSLDGLWLATELSKMGETAQIPLIIISGGGVLRRQMPSNVKGVLPKPFSLADLTEAIFKVLST